MGEALNKEFQYWHMVYPSGRTEKRRFVPPITRPQIADLHLGATCRPMSEDEAAAYRKERLRVQAIDTGPFDI